MKLTLNPQISIATDHGRLVIRYPDGFQAHLSVGIREVIDAFRVPAEPAEVGALLDRPGTLLEMQIGKLQDLVVLVPADDHVTTRRLPDDLLIAEDDTFRTILRRVRGYTMGTPELCYALYQAVAYICSSKLRGAIVESGVWRGGNIALCALALLARDSVDRDLYGFDTFDWSWPELSPFDSKFGEGSPEQRNAALRARGHKSERELDDQLVSLTAVRSYLRDTGYPADRLFLVQGLVQDTVPAAAPERIALLRLDTDLYESTYHELEHLYPRLEPGGILLVDDYPTEHGCKKAVEEYFALNPPRPFLSRIHVQGRIGIKP